MIPCTKMTAKSSIWNHSLFKNRSAVAVFANYPSSPLLLRPNVAVADAKLPNQCGSSLQNQLFILSQHQNRLRSFKRHGNRIRHLAIQVVHQAAITLTVLLVPIPAVQAHVDVATKLKKPLTKIRGFFSFKNQFYL